MIKKKTSLCNIVCQLYSKKKIKKKEMKKVKRKMHKTPPPQKELGLHQDPA